jgi:hypothetical protein
LIFVEEDYNSMEGSILYDEEGSILFYDRHRRIIVHLQNS